MGHRTYRGRCQLGRHSAVHRASLTANPRDGVVDVSSRFPARNLEQRIAYDHIERVGEARVLADRGVVLYLVDGRTLYFWTRRYHRELLDQLRGSGVHVDKRVEYVAPMGARGLKI
jgi:hypothetical protein